MWQGNDLSMRYTPMTFDELPAGTKFVAGSRSISREDISAFAALSGDHTALHSDEAYAASTPFGRVVAHGALNLAIATGLAYSTGVFEGTVLAVRSMEVAFDRPVYPGDELSLELTVAEVDSRPRADRGCITFDVIVRNQGLRTVISGQWKLVMRRGRST